MSLTLPNTSGALSLDSIEQADPLLVNGRKVKAGPTNISHISGPKSNRY
jgi:hypothetical protein